MPSQDTYELRLAHCPEPSCRYKLSHRSYLAIVAGGRHDPLCPACGGYRVSEFREDGRVLPPPVRAANDVGMMLAML